MYTRSPPERPARGPTPFRVRRPSTTTRKCLISAIDRGFRPSAKTPPPPVAEVGLSSSIKTICRPASVGRAGLSCFLAHRGFRCSRPPLPRTVIPREAPTGSLLVQDALAPTGESTHPCSWLCRLTGGPGRVPARGRSPERDGRFLGRRQGFSPRARSRGPLPRNDIFRFPCNQIDAEPVLGIRITGRAALPSRRSACRRRPAPGPAARTPRRRRTAFRDGRARSSPAAACP